MYHIWGQRVTFKVSDVFIYSSISVSVPLFFGVFVLLVQQLPCFSVSHSLVSQSKGRQATSDERKTDMMLYSIYCLSKLVEKRRLSFFFYVIYCININIMQMIILSKERLSSSANFPLCLSTPFVFGIIIFWKCVMPFGPEVLRVSLLSIFLNNNKSLVVQEVYEVGKARHHLLLAGLEI